jgi:uncharacterized protein involved in outer membrane biogenesis
MNEQPSPQPRVKRWKWILGIAAIVVFSATLAVLAILSSIDFNKLKPLLTQVVKQETGRDLEIRGAIDFKLGLRPSLVMEDILFQNAPWASRPEMVKIKRFEAKILVIPLLIRELRITRLVLFEPDVLLETDKSGKWNFEFEKPEASLQKATASRSFTLPRMAFHQVQVDKGKVSYRDGGTGMLCCLSIDRLTAHSEGIESPVVLAFSGSYKDKPLELRGTVGSLLLLMEAGKGYPVDLTAKASSAQLKVEGTIGDMLNLKGLALKTTAEVQSTSEIAKFVDKTLPMELGPLRASVAISDAGDKTYKLSDLRISSKAGDAEGDLALYLGAGRPKLSGSVASQYLNLKPFLSDEKTKEPTTDKAARKNRVFPNDPLPLESLKRMDLKVKVDAKQVKLPHLSLTNLSMEVALDDGRLALRPIKLKVAGGDGEGRLEVRPQGKVATAAALFKVNQMDLSLLSADLKAEGKADVDLDLLSRGSSIAALMAGLNGRTVVVMGQGRVDNKNIQILGGELASEVFQLFNPSSTADNQTDINCGVSGFEIKDGMAKVTALVVDTPDMTVIGEGQVNLRDETLDLALKPYPKGGAAGFSLSLGELAKSFKLGGTLAEPSLQVDAGQTMLAALKAAGGVLLFGPAGIAAALAGQSSGEGDPCLSALESARKGVRTSGSRKGEEQKGSDDKGIAGTLQGVVEGVKKFISAQGAKTQSDRHSDPYGGAGP